ncbi:MAG: hypothetical protein LBU67_04315, partial [Oscillospiraceae bacterium]|nr:hypothetical protein [Oscillospiraceae bacterium]
MDPQGPQSNMRSMQGHKPPQTGRDLSQGAHTVTINGVRYTLKFNNHSARVAEDIYADVYGRDIGYYAILSEYANLRDSEAVFADCIDALGKVSNETDRDALAMELFGKKAQDLNPLIVAGGDALKALGEEGVAAGAVFSGEALDAMGGFDDSMQRLNATGEGLKNTVGLLLIPAFQPLVDLATSSMADVSSALKDGLQPGEMDTIITKLTTNIGGAMTEVSGRVTEAIPVV